jgi:hypothetical protein
MRHAVTEVEMVEALTNGCGKEVVNCVLLKTMDDLTSFYWSQKEWVKAEKSRQSLLRAMENALENALEKALEKDDPAVPACKSNLNKIRYQIYV